MKEVKFINRSRNKGLQLSVDIETLLRCFGDMGLSKPVCYIFVGDEDLLLINKQALRHDYYTDIISFDYSDDPDFTHNEVYISVDRVAENSKDHQTSFRDELLRVCVHGMLHLGGYDDKTPEQVEKIRAAENAYLDLSRST